MFTEQEIQTEAARLADEFNRTWGVYPGERDARTPEDCLIKAVQSLRRRAWLNEVSKSPTKDG